MAEGMRFFTQSAPRALPVIILADVSGSMDWKLDDNKRKIDVLNAAVKDMIDSFADETVIGAEIRVCVISFGAEAKVEIPLTAAKQISYTNLSINGNTQMGKAFDLARQLVEDKTKIDGRAYAPAIVLVSDGAPTDKGYWQQALKALLASERARKADRMAMFIGDEKGRSMMGDFVAGTENKVCTAKDSGMIHEFFKFVTMSVVTRGHTQDRNINEDAQRSFTRGPS